MDFWVILRTVDQGESCGIGFIAKREEKEMELVLYSK